MVKFFDAKFLLTTEADNSRCLPGDVKVQKTSFHRDEPELCKCRKLSKLSYLINPTQENRIAVLLFLYDFLLCKI
jgi:hypothetical protein